MGPIQNWQQKYQNNICNVLFYVFVNFGQFFALFLCPSIVDFKNCLIIVSIIKWYLMEYFLETPNRRYIYWNNCETLICNCPNGQPYVMFFRDTFCQLFWRKNFYHFIAIPIGKTCQKSFMRFNSCICQFKQVFTLVKGFNISCRSRFLTNIVNKLWIISYFENGLKKDIEVLLETNFRHFYLPFKRLLLAIFFVKCKLYFFKF